MHLFPERDGRSRRFLIAALALSLIVHVDVGLLWPMFERAFAHAPPPENVVAQIDPITIERLPPSPTPSPTPTPPPLRPKPMQGRPLPAPRKPARAIAPALAAVPKLALPTYAPAPEPTARPQRHATVHLPPARVVAQVSAPHGASGAANGGALNTEQIASLDATFRKTIDQAQRDAAAAPQSERPAAVQTMKRYAKVLDGTVTDVLASDGVCDPLDDGTVRGPYTYYYLRCTVHFTDGFAEVVSFPWPYKFTRRNDPFQFHDGRPHEFPSQAPPAGFVLPHPFALSRTICAFYRDDCVAVLKREQENGNVP